MLEWELGRTKSRDVRRSGEMWTIVEVIEIGPLIAFLERMIEAEGRLLRDVRWIVEAVT
jgi:hypothetical protein